MKSQIDSRTQWDVWSAAIYLYHHAVAHMKRSSSPSLSRSLVDSATAVEKEVARADDGSACPGCRTHGQARRHAALAVAKRGRVALGPGRSPSARVGDMREKSDRLVTQMSQLFMARAGEVLARCGPDRVALMLRWLNDSEDPIQCASNLLRFCSPLV